MLRGAAHNLGHSFLSLMNYLKYDYCLDYLYAISRVKKSNRIDINFLDCRLKHKCFDLRELICAVYAYRGNFYFRIAELGISPAEIESVNMKIKLDNKKKKIVKSHKIRGDTFSEVFVRLKNGKEYINSFHTKWPLDSDNNYKKLYKKIIKYNL